MSEYIKSLRQHLGHTPLLQVGASVIVINEAGQMLMQQRTDCGSWGYAGGSVELGESVEQTAERELFEETGLKAQKLELLGVYSGEKCSILTQTAIRCQTLISSTPATSIQASLKCRLLRCRSLNLLISATCRRIFFLQIDLL